MVRAIKSGAFISRDTIDKKIFKDFIVEDARIFSSQGTPSERSVAKKKFLKEFIALFKKTYKRAPAISEIEHITRSGHKIINKHLVKGKDFLTHSESLTLALTDPALKESRLKTRISRPVKELSFMALGTKKGETTIVPRFVDKAQENAYKKLLKEKYSVPKGVSPISNEDITKKFFNTKNPTKNQIEKIKLINAAIKKELNLEYPKQTYEGEALLKQQQRARRTKAIKAVSSPSKEAKIRDFKKGSSLDLAHRSSLAQNKKLGLKYLVSDLGFDPSKINQEIIIPTEQKLESLYKKQKFLVDKGKKFFLNKNKKIPLTLQKALEDINKKITDVVYGTNGRLNGIVVDEKTLKAGKVGIDYSTIPGMGLIEDKAVKDLTQADMDLIKLNVGNQIENETQIAKNLTKLYQSGSPELRKSFDKRIGCKTGCFVKKLNENPQKMIRLFRGESFPQRNIKAMKDSAKHFGTTLAEMKKDKLSGQWFTPEQSHAAGYLSRPGQMKYVDVTPAELEAIDKYKARVNKANVKWSESARMGKPYKQSVTTSPHHKVIPRYKLKQLEEAGRLKTKWDLNLLKKGVMDDSIVKSTKGVLEWDSVLGGFVDSGNPSEIVGQNQIKAWAEDNPMKVKVGEAPPGILRKTGKALAHLGLPLPTAAMDAYFIGREIEEGKSPEEIARNPLNWLGLATMDPLTKAAGMAEKSGKLASIMRLGMSPGLIRGATRFLGLPGLALSTGLTAYDQYQKYKQKEGFVYNLFNREEIDNTQV